VTEPNQEPFLLGLDVGSTHAKAGLFAPDGQQVKVASRPMPLHRAGDGGASFDSEQVWGIVCDAIREVIEAAGGRPVAAIGVTSMAESGILLDRSTGSPRSHLIPWFDTGAAPDAEWLASLDDPFERFRQTGLAMNHKAGLAKILSQVRLRGKGVIEGAIWLSTADFVTWRLTGAFRTDPDTCRSDARFRPRATAMERSVARTCRRLP
jgi:sugar (pentulose or hexulose) kinase